MEYASIYYEPEWLEILRAQEDILRMEKLTADDCLKIGLIMERLAREVYKKPMSIRMISDGQITFSYYMEGTNMHNLWWMDKKLNVSRMTGMSSIRALVEIAMEQIEAEPEFENEGNYALCGGCFPIRNSAGKLLGYAQSSGMPHQYDHQLIADALAEYTGKKIPRIEGNL